MHDGAGQVQACRLRVSRLLAGGALDAGADNLYVTDALIRIGVGFEVSAGTDFEQKNGSGALCIDFKEEDEIKRLNLTLEVCTPDPELIELLSGGVVAYDDADAIGFSMRKKADDPASPVAIEGWSRAILDGTQEQERPWWHSLFPFTKSWRFADFAIENGIRTVVLNGVGYENANFVSPFDDVPDDIDQAAVYSQWRDAEIPDSAFGYQVLPAS